MTTNMNCVNRVFMRLFNEKNRIKKITTNKLPNAGSYIYVYIQGLLTKVISDRLLRHHNGLMIYNKIE